MKDISRQCPLFSAALRYNIVACVFEERGMGPADQYLGTTMTILYCGSRSMSRSMKTDLDRSRILCTLYGAVDFLIVPYKGLYG